MFLFLKGQNKAKIGLEVSTLSSVDDSPTSEKDIVV